MDYFDWLKGTNGVELNMQQRRAASFDKGNALVLSTAGSGKTTVTIARVGRLLYEKKSSRKILTITFSKMAANDMKSRFVSYFGDNFKAHAEFSGKKGIEFEILKNNYQALGDILKKHYSKSYFNYVSDEEIENLSSAIGYISNMMINPADYKEYGIEIKDFDVIFEKYRSYKSQHKLIDFDDMLIYAHKILSGSVSLRKNILNTYEYVQIDEMQDTSNIQLEIIKLITHDNLFMVGDDDQAIYSFRGSNPDFMLNFQNIYKDGSIFYLDNNFRSDKNIVEGAKNFIEKNENRYVKEISTDNEKVNEINIKRVNNRSEQSKLIIGELNNRMDCTVGILYRYNMSAMIFANSLYENNISFYIKEDKTKFFSNPVLYDILSFLYLALDPKNREAFSRIYYKSYTYFTKNMCKMVIESERTDLNVFDILDNCSNFEYYVYDKIKQFRNDINYLNKLNPDDAIRYIKTELEYKNYLDRMHDEGRTNITNSLHVLEILEEIGSYCSNISEFINKVNNLQDVIKNSSENKNAKITLSTIHSAKGLEYDYVYLIDNIDGEFPGDMRNMKKIEYEKMLEEERRVFYVGMTRAKKELNIIIPGVSSLFVNELINSNRKTTDIKLGTGQKVKHKIYGIGIIADIDKNLIYIKFSRGKTRCFDMKISLENNIIEMI